MKKEIGFVEYMDEASAGVAKDALHNYKLDGENKIKVTCHVLSVNCVVNNFHLSDYLRKEVALSESIIDRPFHLCSTFDTNIIIAASWYWDVNHVRRAFLQILQIV